MEFNLAVEDVHGGETEAIAALGSVVLAKVSREKESIGGTLQGNRTISRRLISWWGWVGLAIDTRTEVDDVQSSLRPQPSSIGRRAVMEWKHQGIVEWLALPRPMLPHCSTAAHVSVSTLGMDEQNR